MLQKIKTWVCLRISFVGLSALCEIHRFCFSISCKMAVNEEHVARPEGKDIVFRAGHSRRIWSELYKVIDSSDVIIQVS